MASKTFVLLRRLAAGAAFVLVTSNAQAQVPSAADKETARNLMDEGDKKRDSGDLEGALKAYEGADAIMKVPTTTIDVAKTLVALGRLIEARDVLSQMHSRPAKPNEPAPFAAARKAGNALGADLNARIPSIQIATNAADGQVPQVTLDGEALPASALGTPRKVNPGDHTIVVRLGAFERKLDLTIAEREAKSVTVDVTESPAKPAQAPPPSASAVKLSTSDGSMYPILMYAGFATAGVGIVVGGITGLMSFSQTSSLSAACPNNRCPADKQSDIDSARSLGNVSTVAFVIAGVGAGAGVLGYVLSSGSSKPSSSTTARAVVGPSYAGLAGTF